MSEYSGEATKSSKYPLMPLVNGWWEKIRKANEFKYKHFGEQAAEAMKFYECGKELNEVMWQRDSTHLPIDRDEGEFPAPMFKMVVGKVSEVVQLFGPSLYHRNPTIIVEPKNLDLPLELLAQLLTSNPQGQLLMQQAQMAAQQQGQPFSLESLFPPDPTEAPNKVTALLLQYYLDYIQRENDKKTHSRRMIDEALIKGCGILWTEQYEPYPGGPVLVGSFYDTVDNLTMDPDAETVEEAWWIARKCVHPVWQVARDYPVSEDFLEKKYGTHESGLAQSDSSEEATYKRKIGKSNDLVEYWKVYSKMGMGHRLKDAKTLTEVDDVLDKFGDNCFLVIAEKVPYPLNLPPKYFKQAKGKEDITETKAFQSCQWPIPFWSDGAWPMTMLAFHEVPNNPWPMSHIRPALGYLKFINWTMSFLTNRIRHSCRTVVGVMASLGDEVLERLNSGRDFEQLPLGQAMSKDGDITKLVHYLEAPPVNQDVWKTIDAVFTLFDKATGLTEIAYGVAGGMRSATEAQIKEGNRSVRPEDMASKTEDALSLVARKEAMAARWLLDKDTVQPVLGNRGAALWEQYVMSGDVEKVAREFNYRVEAGSTRKPNKETRVSQITEFLKAWGQPLLQIAMQTQNVTLINAMLKRWCEAMEMESKDFMLPPPPPPPPNPMIQKVQAEIERDKEKAQIDQQVAFAKLQAEREKNAIQMQAVQAKTQADVQKAQIDMQIKQAQGQQQIELDRQQMMGDMQMQQMQLGMKQHEIQMGHQQRQQEMAMDQQARHEELGMQREQHHQTMAMEGQRHAQTMQQGQQSHSAKLQQGEAAAKSKIAMQRQAAKAKPKPKPKKGRKK